MRQPGLQVDERSASIFRKVCTRMYVTTIALLWLDVFYRQVWLRQPITEILDIALILIASVTFAIGAILYSGGVILPRFRASIVVVFYLTCVVAGTVFWVLKDSDTSAASGLAKLVVVACLSAIFVLLYLLAAYLGTRKLDKELGE
jgi:hypothetical protein